MLKRTLAALIVALTAFCGGTAQAEPLKLTFSTGSVGGGFFAVGSGIAGFASQKIPGISITAISAAGVVESINRLEQGKADFAMLNTQDPPLAWEGKAPYKKQYRNMRGMGILYMQAAQPYTLKSSGIRTFKDLKGKTLSVGAPGGTMHLDFFRWVEANGLDPKKDFGKVLFLPASEAMEAVKTGQVDVAVELSSIPSPQISELSILRPVHILEFLPGARADMMQKYPQYLPTTIEKGAYNGIDQPIETVGTGAMFACRADLPDDLVYENRQDRLQPGRRRLSGQRHRRAQEHEPQPCRQLQAHPPASRRGTLFPRNRPHQGLIYIRSAPPGSLGGAFPFPYGKPAEEYHERNASP